MSNFIAAPVCMCAAVIQLAMLLVRAAGSMFYSVKLGSFYRKVIASHLLIDIKPDCNPKHPQTVLNVLQLAHPVQDIAAQIFS